MSESLEWVFGVFLVGLLFLGSIYLGQREQQICYEANKHRTVAEVQAICAKK